MGVSINVPTIPTLEESGLKVELSSHIHEQISFWHDLKTLYSYYKNKLKNQIHHEAK